VLEKRIAELNFPVLCANITVEATGKSFAEPQGRVTINGQ
jgi:2',3'-cyclic-nucleotide 2'-phosphodiesterase (5'-nucleotidase family)